MSLCSILAIPYPWVREMLSFKGMMSRGAQGTAVRFVQECLVLAGIGLPIDGIFGGQTATGVRCFQDFLSLPVSGEVDFDTHQALIVPFLRALTPLEPREDSLGELAMAYAHQHLTEHPCEIGGQNRGPWVRMYMEGLESLWCAGFVCFILKQAADQIGVAQPVGTTFSCDELARRGQRAGIFLSEAHLNEEPALRSRIKPGSVFVLRRGADDWIHTGLVVAAGEPYSSASSRYFVSIEGNTNDQGSPAGCEVCIQIREFTNTDFILIG